MCEPEAELERNSGWIPGVFAHYQPLPTGNIVCPPLPAGNATGNIVCPPLPAGNADATIREYEHLWAAHTLGQRSTLGKYWLRIRQVMEEMMHNGAL